MYHRVAKSNGRIWLWLRAYLGRACCNAWLGNLGFDGTPAVRHLVNDWLVTGVGVSWTFESKST